jgi:membrane associated rhomboid family serine protease
LPGDPYTPTVGASGAIFGLFGALFAIGFKLGPPGMQLIRSNIGILVINLIFTFSIPFISKWGHVGGLCAGFLLTLAIFFPPQPVRATVVDAQSGAELESELQAPDRSSGL